METKITHAEREHADLGASSAHRWINCPGSLNLSRQLGVVSKSSSYAEEGTAAHELAHLCLLRGMDAIEYIDRRLPSWEEGHAEVDDEMATAVQVYLDKCRTYVRENVDTMTEQKFNLKPLNPPAPMFGTADFVAIDVHEQKITIIDFKYGKGVNVEAKDNPQLKYYALGALCMLKAGTTIKTVETVVVQPRTAGPPIKTATYKASDIFTFAADLMGYARATMAPDAPLVAGSWCMFCPASGQCPAQRDAAYALAQTQFSVDPGVGEVLDQDAVVGSIAALTPEQYARILNDIPVLEAFIKAVKTAARELLSQGVDIPMWQLDPGKGPREWTDVETIAARLTTKLGLVHNEVVVTSVVSPAKAETMAINKLRAMGMKLKDAEAMVKQTLAQLTFRADATPKLVRSKGQPGLLARGSEFTLEQRPADTVTT